MWWGQLCRNNCVAFTVHHCCMVSAMFCILTLSKHPWMSPCPSVCPLILHLISLLHAVEWHGHHPPSHPVLRLCNPHDVVLCHWPTSGPHWVADGRGIQGLFDQSGLWCGEQQAGRSSRRRDEGRRAHVSSASEQENRLQYWSKSVLKKVFILPQKPVKTVFLH